MLAWAQFTHIIVFLLALVAVNSTSHSIDTMIVITGAVCFLGSILTSIGGLLTTWRSPFHSREHYLLLRLICLIGSIVLGSLSLLMMFRILTLMDHSPLQDHVLIPIVVSGVIVVITSSVGTLFITEWLASIARAAAATRSIFFLPRVMQPRIQPLFVAMPVILGPIGGLITTACCFGIFKQLDIELARNRQLAATTRASLTSDA